MGVSWRIELLGGLRAVSGNREITRFRTQKTALLLAYLACHLPRSHTREQLLDLFWPELQEEHGRHSLSMALSALRRQLEPPGVPARSMIVADRARVGLNPGAVVTDLAEFEAALSAARHVPAGPAREQHLTRAVEIYRGPLLPGYYDEWVIAEQRRLAEAYWATLSDLIDSLEGGGAPDRALEYARRAVQIEPTREEAHAKLMRLYGAVGQPGAALRQYRALEQVLAKELGVAPSAPVREFAAELTNSGAESAPQSRQRRGTTPVTALASLPSGTATFILVEWTAPASEKGPGAHAALTREMRQGTLVTRTAGLSTAVFSRACDALSCAMRIQGGASGGSGEPECRIALHTGDLDRDASSPRNSVAERATRILEAAHPGQILCSEETALLARRKRVQAERQGVQLTDLGAYWLMDAEAPERLFQADPAGARPRSFPPLNAEPAHGGKLPAQFTRFIGREEEQASLMELVLLSVAGSPQTGPGNGTQCPGGRLITLRGAGGTGKTRLAVESASRLAEVFRGTVWFVSLSDITDPRLLLDQVLEATGVPRSPGEPPLQRISAALAGCPALLVLDNLEHLLPEAALAVRNLLEVVPTLICLATSRQTLNLAGEQVFPLGPLPTPNGIDGLMGQWLNGSTGHRSSGSMNPSARCPIDFPIQPEQLLRCESVRLFVDRARAVRPDFRLTDTNAASVAELCRRLEGIPLAIELAAAQARLLTPLQMLAQLQKRIDLLTTRKQDVPPRHQTLWAAIDWSYRLLSPDLQRFFTLLSVFRGGWTPEAAEAIWKDEGGLHPLDALARLEEASLIQVEELPPAIRFRMLETWRTYARERLGTEERLALSRAHATYFLSLAEEAERGLQGPEQDRWMSTLAAEQDNFRAVLQWSLEHEPETTLRLSTGLLPFWSVGCRLGEGRMWLSRALEVVPAEGLFARARALYALAVLLHARDERGAALSALEESLALLRLHGSSPALAHALCFLGYVRSEEEGGYGHGRALAEEALSLFRTAGDRPGLAQSLSTLGRMAVEHGECDAARPLLHESLAIHRDLGNRRGIAQSLRRLSTLAESEGQREEARRLCEEAVTMFRAVDDRLGLAYALYALGSMTADCGEFAPARALLDESLTLVREAGNVRTTIELLEILERTAARLGDSQAALAYRREAERLSMIHGMRQAA